MPGLSLMDDLQGLDYVYEHVLTGGNSYPRRTLQLIIILLALLGLIVLQTIRVLKQQHGMTAPEITALFMGWIGLKGKDEL